ncbi:helix-turn-helix domain-containing protein [Streptomyces sp. NPDC087297]|uniref:helix-turn-helix domain-containing protein n=1 Tax=Streptomyces sp. NPDC087297 TaxID=3365778 RepID=UPI0037F1C027
MGRPRRDISADTGKHARLARQLSELRPRNTTLADLAKLTGISPSTLSRATKATECPSWKTMLEYLTAFGEDPDDWRPQWDMCATERQRSQAGVPADPAQRAPYQRMMPTSVLDKHTCAVGLRELRIWRGSPTYAAMSHHASKQDQPVAKTTISDVLNAKIVPSVNALKGILAGLGMSPDDPEYDQWLQARRVLEATEMRQKIATKALQHATNRRVHRARPMLSPVRRED